MKLAYAISIAIAALIFGSAAILVFHGDGWRLSPMDVSAIRFTVFQAGLSAIISTLFAVPLARALFRRRFFGRDLLISAMSAPFVLPVLAAILGLMAIFGRSGPVNSVLTAAGLQTVSIYGLHGIILANVFFNLPLATRMLLHGWHSIPSARFRLAQALLMHPKDQFWHLEWPMLRRHLGGILVAIFLICLTSFAISLTLGGGPKSSTIELAIYQALRFDFDLGRAAVLAAVQFALCAGVAIAAMQLTPPDGLGIGIARAVAAQRPSGLRWIADCCVIVLTAVFLLAPLIAALASGISGLPDLPRSVWPALFRSVLVAVGSAALASIAALILAMAAAKSNQKWLEFTAMLPLAASGLVLGTGLFLAFRPFFGTHALALPITLITNTALTLPFLYRLLLPEARQFVCGYARLTLSLGLPLWPELRFITLPMLARPLGYGAGLAAALSMGDLGVNALFADVKTATLPLLVQQLMGAYRMDQAAAATLVLVVCSGALFFALDRIGKYYADA